jgi:acyl-CoA synthetase (AMP-forming)/AMP-acid ligase II
MSDNRNIAAMLRDRAAEQPDAVAIRFMKPHAGPGYPQARTDISYAELIAAADRYARGFEKVGITRGMRTLVLASPSLDFYAFMFGLFELGAIPVFLDPGMGIPNMLKCIEQNKPEAMIALPIIHAVACFAREPFANVRINVTVGPRWFWGGATLDQVYRSGGDAPWDLPHFEPHEEAAIIFTSGSTGPPKGVSFGHGAFHEVTTNIGEMFGYGPGDVHMEAFASFVFFDACLGMTTVVPDANLTKLAGADPRVFVQAINDQRCNSAFASPIVWAKLTRHCEGSGEKLGTLERAVTTGAPIHADMHRRFHALVEERVKLHTPYGATECLTVATFDSRSILADTWCETAKGAGTCVGTPVPGADVYIIGVTEDAIPVWDDGLVLPPGEIGEITVGSGVASPEYKERPDANALAKIQQGDRILHRMGDLGYLDEQGRLWFCGRKSHRIETPQGLVPAVPVENIVNEHPAVFRSALVGLGARGQELPVLLVELEQGQQWSDTLAEELRAKLDGTRWEGVVTMMEPYQGFPVDPRHNSKIRREDLKAWVETRFAKARPRLETGGAC